MHAYMITGSDEKGRTDKITSMRKDWNVSRHNVILLSPVDGSIGIDAVRSIIPRLSLKPSSGPLSVLIVRNAHSLTDEAQQALLKTLEEPPGAARILLETGTPYSLLPTIQSRCHSIRLSDTPITGPTPDEVAQSLNRIDALRSSPVGQRMNLIDTIASSRDNALTFVDQAIRALEHHLRLTSMTGSRPVNHNDSTGLTPTQTAKLLRRILTARTQLLGNSNPKLALDAVFLP